MLFISLSAVSDGPSLFALLNDLIVVDLHVVQGFKSGVEDGAVQRAWHQVEFCGFLIDELFDI